MIGLDCSRIEESSTATRSAPIRTLLHSTSHNSTMKYACVVFDKGGVKWTHNPAPQVKMVLTDCVHSCHFVDMQVMC